MFLYILYLYFCVLNVTGIYKCVHGAAVYGGNRDRVKAESHVSAC